MADFAYHSRGGHEKFALKRLVCTVNLLLLSPRCSQLKHSQTDKNRRFVNQIHVGLVMIFC